MKILPWKIIICLLINFECSQNMMNESHEWVYSEKLINEGYEIVQSKDHIITVSRDNDFRIFFFGQSLSQDNF